VRSEPRLVGYAFTPQIQSPEHGQDLGAAITVLSGPNQTSCVMVTFGVRLDPRSALAVTVTQTYPGGDLVRRILYAGRSRCSVPAAAGGSWNIGPAHVVGVPHQVSQPHPITVRNLPIWTAGGQACQDV
jgi:hypothetical protein